MMDRWRGVGRAVKLLWMMPWMMTTWMCIWEPRELPDLKAELQAHHGLGRQLIILFQYGPVTSHRHTSAVVKLDASIFWMFLTCPSQFSNVCIAVKCLGDDKPFSSVTVEDQEEKNNKSQMCLKCLMPPGPLPAGKLRDVMESRNYRPQRQRCDCIVPPFLGKRN